MDEDGSTLIEFDGQRFVVVGGSQPAGRRVHSSTVRRKDGTYLSKLTMRRVISRDAGLYVCLSTNSAGYSYRSAYLIVFPR